MRLRRSWGWQIQKAGKSGRKKRQMSESNEIWGGLGMVNAESGKSGGKKRQMSEDKKTMRFGAGWG